MVVRCPEANGGERLLGLVAEQATETLRRDDAEFLQPAEGAGRAGAAYLGPIASDANGFIQRIEVPYLLNTAPS